jgi:lipoic acid synthetase
VIPIMEISNKMSNLNRKPIWLKQSLPVGGAHENVRALVKQGGLHTVCQEARCPNLWECFSQKTATFMIMGSACTRKCRFCAVEYGPKEPPDPDEPDKVASATKEMGLSYVVITSVTRDDLADGGASFFRETIEALRGKISNVRIEVLVPDFNGNQEALRTVLQACPDVLNHNIETCNRLYSLVRPGALYGRSLGLLRNAKAFDTTVPVKSGMMLGLGESFNETIKTFEDLLASGCSILTLGQYLQPLKEALPVSRYLSPEEFQNFREKALEMGFSQVMSGPFVRSSYHAKELFKATIL